MGSLMISSLDNHCWVWWWKDFENWSTFAEVMGKNQLSCFFDSLLQWCNNNNNSNNQISIAPYASYRGASYRGACRRSQSKKIKIRP